MRTALTTSRHCVPLTDILRARDDTVKSDSGNRASSIFTGELVSMNMAARWVEIE